MACGGDDEITETLEGTISFADTTIAIQSMMFVENEDIGSWILLGDGTVRASLLGPPGGSSNYVVQISLSNISEGTYLYNSGAIREIILYENGQKKYWLPFGDEPGQIRLTGSGSRWKLELIDLAMHNGTIGGDIVLNGTIEGPIETP